MPTKHPRILVTRTPHVDDVMERGRRRLGVDVDYPASAILVELAERGLAGDEEGLLIRRATGRTITSEMVAAALDED
ncbi:hypothetical protein Xcel_0123 [Xylanimonas cellulosilytica DSM 15894]|uniref:Uncharacterized protein n=1 Tax=Xylanimonas cellulosilytica (strain DSM 15894 / JCM 12276 / CECT 5975 / KCTC 9989 / LMG 20990 / NBRC 107835 / XIL07) TaxID=446471 RepID=D1BU00_XYLCX|nr:hypothetical protein [Xylanimonas cellulosilytica]ACZ29164.1 hypothetical protein Xcel_0123 [Xylanimonas cellulosilytica DSM 15894]